MDNTYQANIYREQGANKLVAKEGGSFEFFNDTFTSTQMKSVARQGKNLTITNLSTASTTLSLYGGSAPTVLPSEYGIINLSCTGTMTNGSARLASGLTGQTLHLRFTNEGTGSTASVLIYASGNASGISGVRLIGSVKTDLSSISIQQSAASYGWVNLLSVDDGIWAITDSNLITEQASS